MSEECVLRRNRSNFWRLVIGVYEGASGKSPGRKSGRWGVAILQSQRRQGWCYGRRGEWGDAGIDRTVRRQRRAVDPLSERARAAQSQCENPDVPARPHAAPSECMKSALIMNY